MKIVFLILILALAPTLSFASTASDFVVNPQATYDIPYGIEKILILDLTLPTPAIGQTFQLASINFHNAGTIDHTLIPKLEIWEDGASPGWDGDERGVAVITSLLYFDTKITGDFKAYTKTDPWRRIFVTIDLKSGSISERTLKLQLLEDSVVFTDSVATGPTDVPITGLTRITRHDASIPTVPVSPTMQSGEALSAFAIRWYFSDLSNNEFGFKILDGDMKEVVRMEQADISYINEMGLEPNTEYSGRRVAAFNDRGESLSSDLAVFPAVRTLTPASVETKTTTTIEVVKEEVKKEEIVPEKSLFEKIQDKIMEIQQQINQLLNQLNEFIKQSAATVFGALQGFLRAFFGK